MRKIIVVGLLVLAGCSSGVVAPAVTASETVCNERFCVDVPQGWQAEIGATYLSFHHVFDPDHTFLTAGIADMEAIVVASGGTWPASAEDATQSFWSLLEEADAASYVRSQRLVGGAIKSWGTHVDGDMWYLLHPVEGSVGIGIEMRAPNSSWEEHADTVFNSLVVNG